jgi:putative tricarboxylic transport membrane protein
MRFGYPRLPIVISIVLGSAVERNFQQSLAMSNGSLGIFLMRPIAFTLVLCISAAMLLAPLRALRRHLSGAQSIHRSMRPST